MEDCSGGGDPIGLAARLHRWAFAASCCLLAVGGINTAGGAGYAPKRGEGATSTEERHLVQSLVDLRFGRYDDALYNVAKLVKKQPDFKLAQLVYADLLAAQIGDLPNFGYKFQEPLVDGHRSEARARLARYLQAPPAGAVPDTLLRLPESAPGGIVVDVDGYRLYLFENRDGRLVRTRDYYVSIGKSGGDKRIEGDSRTPVGVYLVNAYIPGAKLPDMYGPGAFPINYPNGWDRLQGRTGDGIWIHGTESKNYSRPPLSSEGCITLSNADFRQLQAQIEISRTPVILSHGVRWLSETEAGGERDALQEAVDSWRQAWESRDTDRYLRHYSRDFRTPSMDRQAFAAYKRRVNASKRFIEVEVRDLGLYRYPGEQELVLVDFVQRYRSDNFNAVKRKHQYWRRENGTWRILYEDGV